jgi:hypothetical protein
VVGERQHRPDDLAYRAPLDSPPRGDARDHQQAATPRAGGLQVVQARHYRRNVVDLDPRFTAVYPGRERKGAYSRLDRVSGEFADDQPDVVNELGSVLKPWMRV